MHCSAPLHIPMELYAGRKCAMRNALERDHDSVGKHSVTEIQKKIIMEGDAVISGSDGGSRRMKKSTSTGRSEEDGSVEEMDCCPVSR